MVCFLKKGEITIKKFLSALMINVVILSCIVYTNVAKEHPYSTPSVLDSAWEKFGLSSYSIGDTDLIISIVIKDIKNKQELRQYLEANLSQSDLNHYTIEISEEVPKEEAVRQ